MRSGFGIVAVVFLLAGLGLGFFGLQIIFSSARTVALMPAADAGETVGRAIGMATTVMVGIGFIVAACFCGIVSRIFQAAAADLPNVEVSAQLVETTPQMTEQDREREVARIMGRLG